MKTCIEFIRGNPVAAAAIAALGLLPLVAVLCAIPVLIALRVGAAARPEAKEPTILVHGVECPLVQPLPCRATWKGYNADTLERMAKDTGPHGVWLEGCVGLGNLGEEGFVRFIRLLDADHSSGDAIRQALYAMNCETAPVSLEPEYGRLIKPRILAHIRGPYTQHAILASKVALARKYFDFRQDIEFARNRAPDQHAAREFQAVLDQFPPLPKN